jgi:hypothetical protein
MHPGARRRPSPRRLLVGIWEKVQQPTSRWVQCSNTNNSMMTTKPSRHQWRHNRTLKRLEVLNPQKNYTEEYHSSGWKRKTAVAPCLPSSLDVNRGRERRNALAATCSPSCIDVDGVAAIPTPSRGHAAARSARAATMPWPAPGTWRDASLLPACCSCRSPTWQSGILLCRIATDAAAAVATILANLKLLACC